MRLVLYPGADVWRRRTSYAEKVRADQLAARYRHKTAGFRRSMPRCDRCRQKLPHDGHHVYCSVNCVRPT